MNQKAPPARGFLCRCAGQDLNLCPCQSVATREPPVIRDDKLAPSVGFSAPEFPAPEWRAQYQYSHRIVDLAVS
jgi:hypothetical protein